jgi:hypothetical protein
MTKPIWVALPDAFMPHHSIVVGGDTEWFEEVSEEDYRAAAGRLHDNRVVS